MSHLDKEKWVEETLESLKGSQRAKAPEDLFESAMKRAASGRARMVRMPALQIWSAAACALLLLAANLFMCMDYSHGTNRGMGSKEMFAKEYFEATDAPQF